MTSRTPASAPAAPRRAVRRSDCEALLTELAGSLPAGSRLFLVGETSQLWEGWIDEAPMVQLTAEGASRAALATALAACDPQVRNRAVVASPGDIIPLPSGHESRARAISHASPGLAHFDPYSVSFRVLARGDEPDYHLVLRYLRHGWITVREMDALLADLLPRFSNETIQQDPAEFRRKYKGLKQMWAAEARSYANAGDHGRSR